MKVKFKNSVWYILLLVVIQGCSTEKNTRITRTYHNITTRYNVLFNASESYKSGIRRAEESVRYDYTQLLPLFLYGDDVVAMAVAGDMDIAARKATKAINIHSIKAKPKVGSAGMTQKQRQFYNKREFNKHMDECYLLIGKSYVFTGDYFLALQTFNFMETEFQGEESVFEARIWRAKALILDNNEHEAGRLLNDLWNDPDFPKGNKKFMSELSATTADFHIRQNRYPDAIRYLTTAIENTRNRSTLMRYRYVLAQLYLDQGNNAGASDMFRRVIRMNPPYEMAFNATINLATASQSGGGDVRDIKRQLNKMLRDAKNVEYHDQIYFTLAQIEQHEGNMEQAIDYYQKSAQASTMNLPQKTQSYLTLGNIFYERRDFITAQAYYDSAMVNMPQGHPEFAQISARTTNLDALVRNLNTVQFQDSVQRIAGMSEAERTRFINNIISDLRIREQRERENDALRQQQHLTNMSRRSTLPDPTARSQWYFYNPSMVTQGISEFQSRWGRRNLEDNWRRSNRGSLEMAMATDTEEEEEDDGRVHDVYTPEYYLQDIPLTDSMMIVSHRQIEEGLYAAAFIYYNDLNEYLPAAQLFQQLISRYPQSMYVVPAYYYLYLLYTELGRTADAERYKNLLLTNAPESVFAKIIIDPGYLERLAQQTGETEQLYEQAFQHFNNGNFNAVVTIANDVLSRFPNDDLLPLFDYLKALSTGRIAGTNEAMREQMVRIVATYGGTEIATAARNLINFIDGVQPELRQAEQVERARTLYTFDAEEPHMFVWMVDSREAMNQLWFDIRNFQIEHFINDRVSFERMDINQRNSFIIVKDFANYQRAMDFYRKFVDEPDYRRNILYEQEFFLISESNFAIMEDDGNIDDYIEFFKTEYQ